MMTIPRRVESIISWTKIVYHLDLPELWGKLYRGSSHGWIATVEDTNAMRLINPLTKVQVELPPRSTFPDVKRCRANKVGEEYTFWDASNRRLFTLSSVEGEFGRLAYCKRGDRKWLYLDRKGYKDIIFHEGKVYALGFAGQLVVYELGAPFEVKNLVPRVRDFQGCIPWYLVEISGEIFMLSRRIELFNRRERNGLYHYKTTFFRAFKLDSTGSRWVGGDVLFLAYNYSLSVPASAFPKCKGNSIYFTDDYVDLHSEGIQGGFDTGVFNSSNGSVEPLPGYNCDSLLVWPPPVCVLISLFSIFT